MSFGDFPFLKPTIKLTNRRLQLAIYAHILSIVGGFFLIISGLTNLIDLFGAALLGIAGGVFILLVELDQLKIPQLKDAQNRGVLWIIIPAIAFRLDFLAIVLAMIGGVLLLAYHNQ